MSTHEIDEAAAAAQVLASIRQDIKISVLGRTEEILAKLDFYSQVLRDLPGAEPYLVDVGLDIFL